MQATPHQRDPSGQRPTEIRWEPEERTNNELSGRLRLQAGEDIDALYVTVD